MPARRHHWVTSLAATASFASLITLSAGEVAGYRLGVAIFATIVGGFAVIYWLMPHSRLFNLATANGLAIYASLYTFFISANFADVPPWAMMTGLPLPVLGFIAGTWVHRAEITAAVQDREAIGHRQLPAVWRWLAPFVLIGGATFFTNAVSLTPLQSAAAMLGAMVLIAAIAALLARHIALFVIDTGLIFEDFWRGLAHIMAPVFAFLTFYLFNVIVFAAVYRLIDRFSLSPHFLVNQEARELTFAECIYFSVMTLSTVGFGDVVPTSDSARLIATLQVIFGAVLILIGVSEILNYTRNRDSSRK